MNTEVDVPNPILVLMPGMYAEVNLTLARRDDVLAIPVDSGGAQIAQNASSGQVDGGDAEQPHRAAQDRSWASRPRTAVEVRSGLRRRRSGRDRAVAPAFSRAGSASRRSRRMTAAAGKRESVMSSLCHPQSVFHRRHLPDHRGGGRHQPGRACRWTCSRR